MKQVRQFYETYGVTFDSGAVPDERGWLAGHCPLHPLAEPNITVNVDDGRWNCRVCKDRGTKTAWQAVYSKNCEAKSTSEALELTSLSQIDDPALYGQKVRVRIAVIGELGNTFHSVHTVRVKACAGISSKKRGPACEACKTKAFNLPLWHAGHIEACNGKEHEVFAMLRKFCCPYNARPTLSIETRGSLREIYCQDATDRMVERKIDDVVQKRLFAHILPDHPITLLPRAYMAEGWIVTNPKTCETTLLIDSLVEHKERHELFQYKEAIPELRAMQEVGVAKLIQYLGAHIAHLTDADDLLMAIWLAYCSPQWIDFNGERIRGWLNVACIGDTGTGKSVSFERISEWLGVGDIFSALTGSRTGLAYSIQFWGGNRRARIQWGVCPRSSGKILCVEEAQELPHREIQALAIAMDTGRLQVDMVASGNCQCATRLLFFGNPPNGKTLNQYSMGCMSARDLFFPMFLRRLDIALFLRRHDNQDVYNKKYASCEHELVTPEMASALVCYAWSLIAERLVFSGDATAAILKEAERISARFGQADDLPLVAPADFRKTLARMCASFAVMSLASHNEFDTITVTDGHVAVIADYIERIYGSPSALLNEYSDLVKRKQGLFDYDIVRAAILRALRRSSNTKDSFARDCPFAKLLGLLQLDRSFSMRELGDIFGETVDAKGMVNVLLRHNLVDLDASGITLASKGVKFCDRFFQEHPEWYALTQGDNKEE